METTTPLFRLVKQLAEREGVTGQLKANNQMEWVARIKNIQSSRFCFGIFVLILFLLMLLLFYNF